MDSGKIIVIEGSCDGVGKTTQYNLLKERLIENGYHVVNHHFPTYDSYQGLFVEKYLNGEFGNINNLSPYFVNSLYACDRAITWNTKLSKAYNQGDIILLDRYTTSSLIYQSALIDNIEEKKKFIDYVCDFEYNKLGIVKPDVVIFLYASFDLVTKIREKRNKNSIDDIHERNLEFMKKVYDNAMFVADYLNWEKVKCDENNEMKNMSAIAENISTIVNKIL